MTFKKFLNSVDAIYTEQEKNLESNRLRYGQIIMTQLWNFFPDKYHDITGKDMDPFYDDKKLEQVINYLESTWPTLSKEEIRIQRLEKKIKKLQASNRSCKKNLEFYEKITKNFPWVIDDANARKENLELKKILKEKNWANRGLEDALNVVNLVKDSEMKALELLSIDINDSFTEVDDKKINNKDLIQKIVRVLRSIRNSQKTVNL